MGLNNNLGKLAEVLTVSGSGNVGVGTTNPTRKLEVYQTGDAFINIRGSYAANSGIIFSDIDLLQEVAAIRNDRVNGAIWFSTGGINSERMRITLEGNLGIGTTTPISRLQSSGTITIGPWNNASTVGNMQLITGGTSPTNNRITYGTDGTGWKFAIGKNQGGTVTDQLVIQTNGNVGIGTTTPGERLEVSGNVVSSNIARYSGTFNSGGSVSFPLKGGAQRARLILVHYWFSGNANINAARLMMVNTRNTAVGGGNSIAVISTTQNSTGTPNEPTSFTQSIGGSGENLTLVIGASLVGGSGSITVDIQEVLA
jgi:hypothetical protein